MAATKLYVKTASGTQAVADLGITVSDSWLLLASAGPSDPEGNSGQFTSREIRDSKDLYDLIIAGTLLWSKDGATTETAGDYLGDFMLMQDFSDDLLDLTDGRFVFPNGTSAPSSGLEGETFWDNDDDSLMVWDGTQWVTVQLGTTDHGDLDGLDDDDHEQYALLTGDFARNAFTGGADFTSASGLLLPTGTDRTGLATTEGNIMWDTDDDNLWLYDGAQWVTVGETIASGVLEHHDLSGLGDDDHPQYLNEARHDALPADNPHSVTFTQAVAADGGTDISAAEAETLTDGSNADLLHTHDTSHNHDGVYSPVGHGHDHGTDLTGLEDDDHPQYTEWATSETVSGLWTFTGPSDEPAFIITPDTDAPTTNVADGAIAIIDGLLSVYDNSRSKFLSVDRTTFVASRRGNATNIYLRGPDGVPTSQTGFRMPRAGTITAVWGASEGVETWTVRIRKGGADQETLAITAADGDQKITSNVDFAAGDELQVYCDGTAVTAPVAGFEVAWRES